MSVADLARDIKSFSSRFINERELTQRSFHWQNGYGSFSYGQSQIDTVCKYIQNQQEHHRKVSFREEYIMFLKAFKIEYDEKFLFDWII
jgi:hypothetical protein